MAPRKAGDADARFEAPRDFKLTAEDYKIAILAWRDALSVNTIIDEMGWEHSAKDITKVRRSLQKAVRWGVLKLQLPRHTELEKTLKEVYPSLDSVHVEMDRTAVLNRSAELLLGEVEEFLRGSEREFVCANAGGRTIADMVALLERLTPIPPKMKDKSINFASLNAAEEQEAFGHCSNYICVRLSELFSAQHVAVVRPGDLKQKKRYEEVLKRANLVITAAGGSDGFLSRWLKQRGVVLPKEFVGDVAFHPLDAHGKPLRLDDKLTSLLRDELQRAPDWDALVEANNKKKLLLVLTGDKFEISRAFFRAGFPRRCVIDSHLAAQLCRDARSGR